ncbi:SNF-related serine/threonine-protein kinase-like isoform X2 [Mercenaria mercenaria]|uniref:SNF-related serine/threonine-protein kinase-like isoform X2 n=1 Tax=Mercenaria mercenaria TaxID=6596 RepID=UPI00234EA0B9|nr:SNF-related serine/threonine-protein kinase-like isoform X2 [Mercenaria mercenaria]
MGDKANSNNRQRASIMPHRKLRSDFDGKIAGLYDLEETIGEGHFAVVKLARHVFTGEKVAVKVIDKTKLDDISKAHLFQEVRCMKLVQHPNVVRLYEVIDTQTKLYLILELGDGGDMYDYIMKHEKGIEENKARLYFRQIVEAISYCHRLHVVHRDLKPENVVFFKKLELVKLTDFGFSNMFNPGNKLETSCGSLAYSAPEILLGDSYDAQAVDIWSLGVILFMLVCGKPPFQEVNDSETLTMIMDCKYQFPPHVSQPCRDLVSLMLRREPGNRATLQQIEEHDWLKTGGDDIPHYHMPLISREQVSEEDHVTVVDKMVEGCIATKEDILQSLEKDMYNHITATYYLLAERRLRKHRADMATQAALMQLRKHSAPPGSHPKPHLEPLALSPRRTREIKKTKTAPISQLVIPESPTEAGETDTRIDYFTTLTDSQTLDRRTRNRTSVKTAPSSPSLAVPHTVRPVFPMTKSVPEIHEPVRRKKKSRAFSRIAILSSYFEQKIAALSGNGSSQKKTGWRLPGFAKKKSRVKQRGVVNFTNIEPSANNYECIQTKDAESAEEKKVLPKQKGLVMSLLSPQGIHPAPSTSKCDSPLGRKCSLIKEESVDEESSRSEDEDLEIESYTDKIRSSKSAENLDIDDDRSNNASPNKEPEQQQVFLKRPLLSVASSPQLLNQICEENESEEEDDFVPPSLNASRLLTKRNSLASPEVIRKYEARRRRKGTGSRGTSCSSSDASDTDDTEGRSRKDKLKQKFVHRRDSSDHSSDTDGGPSGHGNGGFGKGLGGGGEGGGGPRRDGDDKGGGGGKKDGKGGSPKSGRNHHGKGKQNNLNFKLGGEPILENGRTVELSIGSDISNRSIGGSRSSLKYVIERDENVSDSDAEDNADNENDEGVSEIKKLRETLIEKLNQENKSRSRKHGTDISDFSSLKGDSKSDIKKLIIARCPPHCDINGGKKSSSPLKVKIDINSNMCCKQQSSKQNSQLKVEAKCCSLV